MELFWEEDWTDGSEVGLDPPQGGLTRVGRTRAVQGPEARGGQGEEGGGNLRGGDL